MKGSILRLRLRYVGWIARACAHRASPIVDAASIGAKFRTYVARVSSYRSRGTARDVTEDHATSPPMASRRLIGPRAGRLSILRFVAAYRPFRASGCHGLGVRSDVRCNVVQCESCPTATYIAHIVTNKNADFTCETS
jgi:hypothetical protein